MCVCLCLWFEEGQCVLYRVYRVCVSMFVCVHVCVKGVCVCIYGVCVCVRGGGGWAYGQVCVCVCVCVRSEEHTSELQSHLNLVCRLLLEKKNTLDDL